MKKCSSCKEIKEEKYFASNKAAKDGSNLQNVCKVCMAPYQRKSHLKSKYNLSLEQYNELLLEYKNSCAICGINIKDTGRGWLCIDHDHTTGKVRGLLCDNCNTGLGMFKDDINLLDKAKDYLDG